MIASIVFVPILFAILTFIFKQYSRFFGLIFSVLWFFIIVYLNINLQIHHELIYYFGGFLPPLGIEFRLNQLNGFILLISSFLILVTTIYGMFYFKQKDEVMFYPLVAFLSCGVGVLLLSTDIFNIYVALELIGICSVALSALGSKKDSIKSAIDYLFASLLGSAFYLLGVAIIYGVYSTLYIYEIANNITNDFSTYVALIFMIIGLSIKTALFPFHYWLPNAHSNALSPISALLSGLVIKTSFYMIFLLYYKVFLLDFILFDIIAYMGLIAIIYGGIQAILTKDLKLMIAYSTISQIGYLFILFGISNQFALCGAFFALISHMLAKGGLFLISGVMIYLVGSKNIVDFKGIAYVLPLSVFTFSLSAISLIGLPPSLGFVSKWYYLNASFDENLWIFFIGILLGGLLSAIYLFRIIIFSFEYSVSQISIPKDNKYSIMQWSAFILSFLSVVLGFFGSIISTLIGV